MTEKQVVRIKKLKMRIKGLEGLLRKLKRDLNYLFKECKFKDDSSTPKVLIISRIKMINNLLNHGKEKK